MSPRRMSLTKHEVMPEMPSTIIFAAEIWASASPMIIGPVDKPWFMVEDAWIHLKISGEAEEPDQAVVKDIINAWSAAFGWDSVGGGDNALKNEVSTTNGAEPLI